VLIQFGCLSLGEIVMIMSQQRRAVGTFATRYEAEQALNELQYSGFPMRKVSIIAQDADSEKELAGVKTRNELSNRGDEGAKTGAVAGGALGGLTGLLVGLGTLAIPGVGPIVLAGEAATALATTAAGGAIGAATGGLVGGLVGLGISEDRARIYGDRISRGEYLVIVDGTDAEINQAQAILNRQGIQDWGIYDVPQMSTSTSSDDRTAHSRDSIPDRPVAHHVRAVGVFPGRNMAEAALNELRNAGFSMDNVSVIAKDSDREPDIAGVEVKDRAGNKADEGAVTGAVTGGAVGGIGGLLVGLGALAIPGIGPVMLAGATATALATTLPGTAIGAAAGSLVGALVGLGIPEEQARAYNDRIARGDYLVVVEGTDDQIDRARAILHQQGIEDWDIFSPVGSTASYPGDRIPTENPRHVI
jgi:hypothetical protein